MTTSTAIDQHEGDVRPAALTVACVVHPGVSPFEFGVACEVFGLDRSDDGLPNFDFRAVAAQPGLVATKAGFSIVVDEGLDFAMTADIVVFAPIPREHLPYLDARVHDVARAAVENGAWVVSLCSGAYALAEAGVLDGKRATTHWMYARDFADRYPLVDVDPDVLFVQQGRIITSAGTAASIDACLHLLRQEWGAEWTNTVARRMVVPPQRDGGQAQFISKPLAAVADGSLAPVAEWALENLSTPLTVDDLARRAHMSPRTFARRFAADFGTSPAAWLARQRVIEAQRLLERTDWGTDRIAAEVGFTSGAVLRQNFARSLGTTPQSYRAAFTCRPEKLTA